MKLWGTVFAFHHNPNATSGTDGTSRSNAPCSTANPTSNASHGECRRMPVLIAGCVEAPQMVELFSPGFMGSEPKALHLLAGLVASLPVGDSFASAVFSMSFSRCFSGGACVHPALF